MLKEELGKFVIGDGATIRDAMRAIDNNWHEVVLVENQNRRVVGVITDGDVRRGLLRGLMMESPVTEVMTRSFVRVGPETDRAAVLDMMKARVIRQVPVIAADGTLHGIHFLEELIGVEEKPNIAVVMAGGKGTRLHPMTEDCPKPMITVAGRPILERVVLHLVGHGIRRIYLAVNHLAHVIEDHFGDGSAFNCEISYLREPMPLGTGGALSLLPHVPSYPVVVLNGDQITQANLGSLIDFHVRERVDATIAVRPYEVEVPFGVVIQENGRLIEIREKPSAQYDISTGIYVLNPAILSLVPKDRAFPITDLFEELIRQRRQVAVYYFTEDWIDVGRPSELQKARGQ
jgi:dTDP-glucose pyrophosphorylase/CBS domain-containing protein